MGTKRGSGRISVKLDAPTKQWIVIDERDQPVEYFVRKRDARLGAIRLLRRRGGGEVVIYRANGNFGEADTVRDGSLSKRGRPENDVGGPSFPPTEARREKLTPSVRVRSLPPPERVTRDLAVLTAELPGTG